MSSIIIELKRRLEDLEKRVAELEMDVPDYGYDIPIPETPREREERTRRESEAWEERERTKTLMQSDQTVADLIAGGYVQEGALAQSGIKRGRGRPRGSRNGQ